SPILDNLEKAKWFTFLNLTSGYWQVKVKEKDKEKTAFITKLMDIVLEPALWKYAIVYIDDINIYSEIFEEHIKYLKAIFALIKNTNLRINPKKNHFCTNEIQFLGHIVGINSLKPDPQKVDKLEKLPPPKNLIQLK
ncbi:18252_t:CDS:2, partial [Racocetra persica]